MTRGIGYPSVVPYVRYRDPAAAITWLCSVFGAHEAIRMTVPDGRVGHAELVVDSYVIAVGLSTEPSSGTGPADRNAVRVMALVFVPDVDAATTRAVELGGFLVDPPTDMPWGLRQSIVSDTEGHVWELSEHNVTSPYPTGERSRPDPGSSPCHPIDLLRRAEGSATGMGLDRPGWSSDQ